MRFDGRARALGRRNPRALGLATLRTVTLHDTRTGQIRELDPATAGAGADLRLRADRLRPRARRQRPPVRRLLAAQAVPAPRGLRGRRSSRTSPTSTTRSMPRRRPPGSRSDELAERDDRRLRRRHRSVRARPARPRAAGAARRSAGSSTLIERADRDAAMPTRPTVTSTSRSAPTRNTESSRIVSVDQMDQGEDGRGSRTASAIRVDFALWKAHKPDEDTSLGLAVGPRAAGLAHRVLGDGRGAARASDFEIHGGGSDLIFPHHENEAAQTRAAPRRPPWRGCGCTSGWSASTPRRCPSRSATSSGSREALERHGPETLLMYFARRPLAPADGVRRRPPGGGARAARPDPRGRPRARRRRPARSGRRRCAERFFDALADDFNTPQALAVDRRVGPARPTASARRHRRRRRPARDARRARRCAGLLESDAQLDAAAEARGAAWTPASAPAASVTGPRPTGCATSCARWAGRSVTGPTAPSCGRLTGSVAEDPAHRWTNPAPRSPHAQAAAAFA